MNMDHLRQKIDYLKGMSQGLDSPEDYPPLAIDAVIEALDQTVDMINLLQERVAKLEARPVCLNCLDTGTYSLGEAKDFTLSGIAVRGDSDLSPDTQITSYCTCEAGKKKAYQAMVGDMPVALEADGSPVKAEYQGGGEFVQLAIGYRGHGQNRVCSLFKDPYTMAFQGFNFAGYYEEGKEGPQPRKRN